MNSRFQKSEMIGRGISSTVFRGYDKSTKSAVAIKVLNPHLQMDPILVERFRRELQIAREIRDPYIISIFDFHEDGTDKFLVMELLDGQDLKTYLLQNHPLPLDFVLTFMKKILTSVRSCHQQGIIHRDLKPQNIFVLKDLNPKILDFGISRMASQPEITVAGTTLGSPEYMAPELFHLPYFDNRSDIYALGIIFFEMLTGELPYQADSITGLYQEHLQRPLPSMKTLRKDIPEWLEGVIGKMTAKEITQRYQGIEEILYDLNDQKVSLSGLKKLKMKYCLQCGSQNVVPTPVCLHCGYSFINEGETKAKFSLWAPDFAQKNLRSFFSKLCGHKLPSLPRKKTDFLIAKKLTQTHAQLIAENARASGFTIIASEDRIFGYFRKYPFSLILILLSAASWYWFSYTNKYLFDETWKQQLVETDPETYTFYYYSSIAFGLINAGGLIAALQWLRYDFGLIKPWLSVRDLFPINTTLNQLEWLNPYFSVIVKESNRTIKNQIIQFIEHYIYITNHPGFDEDSLKMELQQLIIIAVELLEWSEPYKNNADVQERLQAVLSEIGLKFNLLIGRHLIVNQSISFEAVRDSTSTIRKQLHHLPNYRKVS